MRFRFKVIPERLYVVEAVTALGGTWQPVVTLPPQTVAGTVEVEVPAAGQPTRYHRCRVIMER